MGRVFIRDYCAPRRGGGGAKGKRFHFSTVKREPKKRQCPQPLPGHRYPIHPPKPSSESCSEFSADFLPYRSRRHIGAQDPSLGAGSREGMHESLGLPWCRAGCRGTYHEAEKYIATRSAPFNTSDVGLGLESGSPKTRLEPKRSSMVCLLCIVQVLKLVGRTDRPLTTYARAPRGAHALF